MVAWSDFLKSMSVLCYCDVLYCLIVLVYQQKFMNNSMKKNEIEDEGAVAMGEALSKNVVLTDLK